MTSTSTSTLPLAVTDLGHGGPALLFVPGWCGNRSVFDGLAARSAQHRRAVTVDLPDHGESPAREDFTTSDVVDALVQTIDGLGLDTVVPVALSHAGWAAIELRRRLGRDAVPGVVLIDWMVLGTPPSFDAALERLQSPEWADVRTALGRMWTDGLDVPDLRAYVSSMSAYGERHWRRAGREIAAGFDTAPVPLAALEALQPCPTMHLYAQPADDGMLAAQQRFAASHDWFSVTRLDARSHFPMFEVPDTMTDRIETFLRDLS